MGNRPINALTMIQMEAQIDPGTMALLWAESFLVALTITEYVNSINHFSEELSRSPPGMRCLS